MTTTGTISEPNTGLRPPSGELPAVSVVLVSRTCMTLDGLTSAFESDPRVRVAAGGLSGVFAVSASGAHHPDFVVLTSDSLDMPLAFFAGMIWQNSPTTKIVVIATAEADGRELAIAQELSNVHAVLSGDVTAAKLLSSIFVAPGSMNLKDSPMCHINRGSAVLSRREVQILEIVAEGLSNPQVAEKLLISAATVKRHMANIYSKLGVSNRVAAVRKARELQVIAR